MAKKLNPVTAPIVEVPSSIILKHYCNAAATYYGCGGHHKAEMNEGRMRKYAEEAKAIGMTLPTSGEAARMGTFNGPGAY